MTAYLLEHLPKRKGGQFRLGRRLSRSPLPGLVTGCTGLHTSEGVMDTVGVDTGAENVARFVQQRTDGPGSYHHIVDSDSCINLVDLDDEAFADGTGSNPWATSLSFACRTVDWRRMSDDRRAGFMRQGALAFKAQQDWRAARNYPPTELRLLTKAQSDNGASGFIYHGVRDPGRRSDPGTTPSAPFPLEEFLAACRDTLTPTPVPTPRPPEPAPTQEVKDMPLIIRRGTSVWRQLLGNIAVPVTEAVARATMRATGQDTRGGEVFYDAESWEALRAAGVIPVRDVG